MVVPAVGLVHHLPQHPLHPRGSRGADSSGARQLTGQPVPGCLETKVNLRYDTGRLSG